MEVLLSTGDRWVVELFVIDLAFNPFQGWGNRVYRTSEAIQIMLCG